MADMPHVAAKRILPPLECGDRLDQKTFHERYEAMPEDFRAELIGGIVFVPSPLRRPHGKMHGRIMQWLLNYEDATPGTEGFDGASAILDPESEPQPDGCLLIIAPGKGQPREEDQYIVGAPELIAEISHSTEAIDLHLKKEDYERAGVREYVVVALRQKKVFWWSLHEGRFEEMQPDADGVFRSRVFPGLWLDPAALMANDMTRFVEVATQGLKSPEHTDFVAYLAQPPGASGAPSVRQ